MKIFKSASLAITLGFFAVVSMMTAPDANAAFMSASSDVFNGHKYELWYSGDQTLVSWDAAKIYATSVGGHLVSITSAAEEATVQGLWGSLATTTFEKVFDNELFGGCCELGVWTGGRSDGQGEDWYWDSGEGAYSSWNGTANASMFTNWHSGHPDNDDLERRMGYIIQNGETGWDNHAGDGGFNIRSFVVETSLPEPGTLGLALIGLAGLVFSRKGKHR
jgi:hypothetical protein